MIENILCYSVCSLHTDILLDDKWDCDRGIGMKLHPPSQLPTNYFCICNAQGNKIYFMTHKAILTKKHMYSHILTFCFFFSFIDMAKLWLSLVFFAYFSCHLKNAASADDANMKPIEEMSQLDKSLQPWDASKAPAGAPESAQFAANMWNPEPWYYSAPEVNPDSYPAMPPILYPVSENGEPSYVLYKREANPFSSEYEVAPVGIDMHAEARCKDYDDYGYGKKHKHHKDKLYWKKKHGFYGNDDKEEPAKEDGGKIFLYNYNANPSPSYSSYVDAAPKYSNPGYSSYLEAASKYPISGYPYSGRVYRSSEYQPAMSADCDNSKADDRYDDIEIENSHNSKLRYRTIVKYSDYAPKTYYETSYSQGSPTIEYLGTQGSGCSCKDSAPTYATYSRSNIANIPRYIRENEPLIIPEDEKVGCHHKKYYYDDDDDKEKMKAEPNLFIYNANENIPKKYRSTDSFSDLGKGFVDLTGKAGLQIHDGVNKGGKKIIDALSSLSSAYLDPWKLASSAEKREADERSSYSGMINKPFLGLLKNPYKLEGGYDLPYHGDFASKAEHNHDEMISKYGVCPYCGKSGKLTSQHSAPHFESSYLKNLGLPMQLKPLDGLLNDYSSGLASSAKQPLVYAHEIYPTLNKGYGGLSGLSGLGGLGYGKGSGIYGSVPASPFGTYGKGSSDISGAGYGSPPSGYSPAPSADYGSNLGLYGSPAYGIKKTIGSNHKPVYTVVDHPATSYTSVY